MLILWLSEDRGTESLESIASKFDRSPEGKMKGSCHSHESPISPVAIQTSALGMNNFHSCIQDIKGSARRRRQADQIGSKRGNRKRQQYKRVLALNALVREEINNCIITQWKRCIMSSLRKTRRYLRLGSRGKRGRGYNKTEVTWHSSNESKSRWIIKRHLTWAFGPQIKDNALSDTETFQ